MSLEVGEELSTGTDVDGGGGVEGPGVVDGVTDGVTLLGTAVGGGVTLGVTEPGETGVGETGAGVVDVALVSVPPPPGLSPEASQPQAHAQPRARLKVPMLRIAASLAESPRLSAPCRAVRCANVTGRPSAGQISRYGARVPPNLRAFGRRRPRRV